MNAEFSMQPSDILFNFSILEFLNRMSLGFFLFSPTGGVDAPVKGGKILDRGGILLILTVFYKNKSLAAVLVAIAIPIFTTQLEKSREATDQANIRDYYAEIATALVTGELSPDNTNLKLSGGVDATYTAGTGSFTVKVVAPKVNQTVDNWQSNQ